MLARQPVGIVRGQEHGDRRDVVRLSDTAQRGLCNGSDLEFRTDESGRMGTFGLDHAGLMELTRILRGPNSRDSTPVMPSTAPLVAVYTALPGGVMRETIDPMLMMLDPSPKCLAAACVTSNNPSTLTLK